MDGFGLRDEGNTAIIESHQAGAVSNATLMVFMRDTEAAVHLARSNPEFGVGLHFKLTQGERVSP